MSVITIVNADDHTLFRQGLKWIFSLENDVSVVNEAATGNEVTAIVEASKPDVLLLDLKMPKGDTEQIVRDVLKTNPSTRVLVLTAFSEEENILNVAKAAPGVMFLRASTRRPCSRQSKPFTAGASG